MAPSRPARGYPASFPASSRGAAPLYRARDDCFAVEGRVPPESGLAVLYVLPAESLTVVAGERAAHPGLASRPVYAFTGAEPPAVPTGKVWIECEPGQLGEDRLRELGYEIAARPPHAPGAAWLRASDGSVASALGGLGRLTAAKGVLNVEPEMLRPRAKRGP